MNLRFGTNSFLIRMAYDEALNFMESGFLEQTIPLVESSLKLVLKDIPLSLVEVSEASVDHIGIVVDRVSFQSLIDLKNKAGARKSEFEMSGSYQFKEKVGGLKIELDRFSIPRVDTV